MDVVGAIADPVRREILTMLKQGPRPAGAIADSFEISRPAVSRHLRVLREHGLVHDQIRGRERVYRLDVAPLVPVDTWLTELFRPDWRWDASFDALETEVHRTRRDRRGERAGAPDQPTASPSGSPSSTAQPEAPEHPHHPKGMTA